MLLAPTLALSQPGLMASIRRVTRREEFRSLWREGARTRQGPITLTWVPVGRGAELDPARVAYAVGRSAGAAVQRNRVKRRLRAAMAALAAEGVLPAGTYLVGGERSVADLAWPDLLHVLRVAVRSAVAAHARARGPDGRGR